MLNAVCHDPIGALIPAVKRLLKRTDFISTCMAACVALCSLYLPGCFMQVGGETLPEAEDVCVNACELIPVLVQDKESSENVEHARIIVSRWYGNTWNTVLECKRDALDAENQNNSNVDGCFLNSIVGLYQFTVVAAGYEHLEKRLRFNSENSLLVIDQDFLECSCMQETALVLTVEPEGE